MSVAIATKNSNEGSEPMNTTITTKKTFVLLSKKGMRELKQAIKQLEHEHQIAIQSLKEIDKTTGHDDRFERIQKLSHLETVESELFEKRELLSHAKLIPSHRARMQVAIGSVVDLIDQTGRLVRYTLVDSVEANPSDGRISILSPLGSSLLGKSTKDVVQLRTGAGTTSLRLVGIA